MALTRPTPAITFPGQIGPTSDQGIFDGTLHPTFVKGGFQTVPTIADRNAIPIWNEGSSTNLTHEGFSVSEDGGYTSGRRQIGMMVHVLDTNKLYTLCPKGYWYNPNGAAAVDGDTEWQALSEWVKAGLLMPNATDIYTSASAGPPTFALTQYTPAVTDANSCWVEVSVAGTVTGSLIPDANEAYDLGNANYKFRDIYMSGNTLYMGGQPLSVVDGGLRLNGVAVAGSGVDGTSGNDGTSGLAGTSGIDGTSGIAGVQGLQGSNGTNGIAGAAGTSNYFHIAYADNDQGSGWSQAATGKLYIGTYVDSTQTDAAAGSNLWGWQLVRGLDGNNGIAGTNGADGETTYLHIAYAMDNVGGGFDKVNAAGKTYIGQYTDFIQADSNAHNDYNWTLIKGDSGTSGTSGAPGIQGLQGSNGTNGIAGADGSNTYFHIAYANDDQGSGWSQVSTGKLYIGTYVDSTQTDATATSALWQWQVFKGSDGENGENGIAGTNGTDGQTSYLHIAYANNGSGLNFSKTNSVGKLYIGQYTDFTSADSSYHGDYSWTLIKGETGLQGYTPVKGQDYFDGVTPVKGQDYFDGVKGDTGNNGSNGAAGAKGDPGSNGLNGSIGPIGLSGPAGGIGPAGPQGSTGAVGPVYTPPANFMTTLTHQHIKRNDVIIQKGDLVKLDENNELIKVTSAKDSTAIGILWCAAEFDENATDKSRHYMDSLSTVISESDRAIKTIWKVAAIGDSRVYNTSSTTLLGGMKVCDQNGTVSRGDLVCSSDIPGYVMKQPVEYIITGFSDGVPQYEEQQSMYSFTIGKCMEDCTFDVNGKVEAIYGYIYCG